MPLAKADLAIIAAAGGANGTTLLLSTIDPIGEPIVRAHVIKLRGWLVVPGAPGLAAVHGKSRALIDAEKHDLRVLRIDPDAVVVIPSGRAFDGSEGVAAIGRAIGGS